MASTRPISHSSFYQKLGVNNLLTYLKSGHPLLETIKPLLEECSEMDAKIAEEIQSLFYTEENSQFNEDAENFSDIANLASDNGQIKLEQLYGSCEEIRQIIDKKNYNNFDIAFQLFRKHKDKFDNVLINSEVERKSNWKFYESSIKPQVKKLENLDDLKKKLLSSITTALDIQYLNLDINLGDKDRWLVCLKHPDKLRVKEKYENNKFKIKSERKALEICLIFIPSDGMIKVHDDQKSQKNIEVVIGEFVNTFMENSEEYNKQLVPTSFNLNAFININNISDLTHLKHSSQIKGISCDSVEFMPNKNSTELIRIKGFNDTNLKSMFERHSNYSIETAVIKEIKVDFVFTGKGTRRRKLTVNSSNGANLKVSESRDEIMRQALISWGVMNVAS